jgi:hypothetical protein
MVGWDDRIEFDLDNNGKAGEPGKDEKGAWIIVNSWAIGKTRVSSTVPISMPVLSATRPRAR